MYTTAIQVPAFMRMRAHTHIYNIHSVRARCILRIQRSFLRVYGNSIRTISTGTGRAQ